MKAVFLGVDIKFRTTWDRADLMGAINLGAITLKKDDREFILDPLNTTFTDAKDGGIDVEIKLDELEEVKIDFPECKFNITDSDLMSRDFDTAEMFIDFEDHAKEDYASDINSITLFYKIGQTTYALELESEMFELVK